MTISLPLKIEAKLSALATAGDSEGIRQVLAEALTPVVESLLKPPEKLTDKEFEAILDEMEEIIESSDAPPLSDYAVSREGIYEGYPRL